MGDLDQTLDCSLLPLVTSDYSILLFHLGDSITIAQVAPSHIAWLVEVLVLVSTATALPLLSSIYLPKQRRQGKNDFFPTYFYIGRAFLAPWPLFSSTFHFKTAWLTF